MIGIIDFFVEKIIGTTNITYDWYECITIALIIELILLPIIIKRNKCPILLGKASLRGKFVKNKEKVW